MSAVIPAAPKDTFTTAAPSGRNTCNTLLAGKVTPVKVILRFWPAVPSNRSCAN